MRYHKFERSRDEAGAYRLNGLTSHGLNGDSTDLDDDQVQFLYAQLLAKF